MFIDEMMKEDVKKKVKTYLVEPSFTFLFERLYPYIIVTSIIFILILLLSIVIIFLLIQRKI